MADPKYAGLPGIATDQPDTYETFSDIETDPEDESESESSEALHMSSLSCVGTDLEIVEPGSKETIMHKFTRLHCEVNEFCEDLNSMTESVREGSLAGLHLQVDKLRQDLENLSTPGNPGAEATSATSDQNCDISQRAKIVETLQKQIQSLETGQPGADTLQYKLYLRNALPLDASIVSKLDRRLARLEEQVGLQQPSTPRILSVKTDNLPLVEALSLLQSKKHTLSTDHLTHIEGRLSALTTKLNALKEQKDRLNVAKSASQVTRIFNSLEANEGLMSVIPEVESRLQDVSGLNSQAAQWNGRLAEISCDQEKTETLLKENSERLETTKSTLGTSLQDVTKKLEKLQSDLVQLKA